MLAALAVLGLGVLFQIVAPFLISSAMVRDRMEQAVAGWTGHDVEIAGIPDIHFWPEPEITLRDIIVRRPPSDGKPARILGRVAQLSASFDLLQALLGQPQFEDFQLIDPELYLVRDEADRIDWQNGGRLSRALGKSGGDGTGSDLSADDDLAIGDMRISGGIVEVSDPSRDRVTRFTGIAAEIRWPWFSGNIDISASAEFNGRRFSLTASSERPLLLLAGKSSHASFAAQSDLFRGRFRGIVDMAAHGFLSGDAELTVPDPASLADWINVDVSGVENIKKLSLSARLAANDRTLRLENLALGLNDAKATGILDLMMTPDRPRRLVGTLAFDRMDFSAMLAALAPDMRGNAFSGECIRCAGLELDLRLSAVQAKLGPFDLSNAAVGVLDTADQSRIDIADSDFEGGRLTGWIATLKAGRDDAASGAIAFRLAIGNADFADITTQLGFSGPRPAAQGSLDIELDVDRPLTAHSWRNAKGTIRFRAESGQLHGVNLAGIRRLAAEKRYFKLSDVGTGSLAFDRMTVIVDLAGGSADIREGRITTSDGTLDLSGLVAYASNSLALSASFQPAATEDDSRAIATFIGGSWPDPVLWPIIDAPEKTSE